MRKVSSRNVIAPSCTVAAAWVRRRWPLPNTALAFCCRRINIQTTRCIVAAHHMTSRPLWPLSRDRIMLTAAADCWHSSLRTVAARSHHTPVSPLSCLSPGACAAPVVVAALPSSSKTTTADIAAVHGLLRGTIHATASATSKTAARATSPCTAVTCGGAVVEGESFVASAHPDALSAHRDWSAWCVMRWQGAGCLQLCSHIRPSSTASPIVSSRSCI